MSNHTAPTPASAQAVWFDIASREPKATQKFYSELFGWTVREAEDEDYAMIASGDAPPSGGIGHGTDDGPYIGFVTYFPVEDLDATLEHAKELGAEIVLPPAPTPMGRIAAFRDPQGHTVGLQGS